MKKNNIKAFSIIEILVGIFIFTLGLTSIYAVIISTLKVNDYNKNYIIATNLAREQIELFRNIRDSNYKNYKKYNQINPSNNEYDETFSTGSYYKIENDYSPGANFPIKVSEITNFGEGKTELKGKMPDYILYLDSENRYTFDENGIDGSSNKETEFYRYIFIDNVLNVDNALKVKSKVIWYKRGYHEFEINTIIADWQRL